MVYHEYTMRESKQAMPRYSGIIPPLVTPFDDGGNVDASALRSVVDYVMAGGVHGVFVAGSTGESYAMTDSQRLEASRIVVDHVQGRIPVFAGTARITTEDTIRLTREAEKIGVDAASIVTPYFITPSQEELYRHFRSVAESTSLPIILYNNPGRTGVVMEPETIARLSELENIVGIKDSSGNMGNTVDTIRLCREGFGFFCGFDMIMYPTLAAGGAGAVPACANIVPQLAVNLYESFRAGDHEESRRIQAMIAPLRRAFTLGTFPSVLKEGLNLLGIPVGKPRMPVTPLEPASRERLCSILEEMSLNPITRTK